MSIQFVEAKPEVTSRHGHFLVSFDSGGEAISVMLTRHALLGLIHSANRERDIVAEQESGFQPSEFMLHQRKQTGLRNG